MIPARGSSAGRMRGRGFSNRPRSPMRGIQIKNWLLVSVGTRHLTTFEEIGFIVKLKDRIETFDDPMHRIHANGKIEVVDEIKRLLSEPRTSGASVCVVITEDVDSDLISTLKHNFSTQLQFFFVAQTEIKSALTDDASLDNFASRFAQRCNINNQTTSFGDELRNSDLVHMNGTETKPQRGGNRGGAKFTQDSSRAYVPAAVHRGSSYGYSINNVPPVRGGTRGNARGRGGRGATNRGMTTFDMRELCNKLKTGALLPGSSELLKTLTSEGRFYKNLENCGEFAIPATNDCILQLVASSCRNSNFKETEQELLQKVLINGAPLLAAVCKTHIEPLEWELAQCANDSLLERKRSTKNLLTVLLSLLERFPSHLSSLGTVLNSTRMILKQESITCRTEFFDEEMSLLLNQIEQARSYAIEKLSANPKSKEVVKPKPAPPAAMESEAEPPPEDFRQIPIFPRKDEIVQSKKPYLRRNVIRGAFQDSEHYLDIQFRLMREDVIAPLREGIKEFLSISNGRVKGLYVYRDVIIQPPEVDKQSGTLIHVAEFQKMKVKWVKRLMPGSLVCLSSDNFKSDLIFAVVFFSEESSLMNGQVRLNFEETAQTAFIKYNTLYVMIESNAYFEAYRPVLESLQKIPKDTPVPFEQYLVKCIPTVQQPKYLKHSPMIDFKCVMKGDIESERNFLVDAFQFSKWPTNDQLGLDQSQYEALQIALTSELAIIQGPPGTGKTYIGHQLTRLLLNNEKCWNSDKNHPILVVCYTNHALDQFLEGIADFMPDGVIRIGGRCQNDKLQNYLLRNVRTMKGERLPPELRSTLYERHRDRDAMKRKINAINSEAMRANRRIVGLVALEKLESISPEHVKQFLELGRDMQQWLVDLGRSTNYGPKLNVVLVTNLVEYYCFPEYVAKIAAYCTGNQDVYLAVDWVYNNFHNVPYLQMTPEVQQWPLLEDVWALIYRGFSEEEALWALEDGRNLSQAIQRVLFAFGQEEVQPIPTAQTDEQADEMTEAFDDKDRLDRFIGDEGAGYDDLVSQQMFQQPTTSLEDEEAGFQVVGPSHLKRMTGRILSQKPLSEREVEHLKEADLWKLPLDARWRLYCFWRNKYQEKLAQILQEREIEYGKLSQRVKEIHKMADLGLLKSAKVLGMTTTGAAKNKSLLQDIQPRIVIMEEAAEVLEAHLLTSLSQGCEHAILIGDHQQLRPNPAVYELAREYHLDISLFERLVNNGFKHAQLKLQHRMRPEISRSLMPHFYPDLQDDQSVMNYDKVRGMQQNMVFLNHSKRERDDMETTSHRNEYEAMFAVGLARYFIQQDYEGSQITILCTYLDQMFAVREFMKKQVVQGVRVTVVDNYQGEECDIIILCWVRSNDEGKIGFLATKNRVCVALSRAKLGFYCFGNFKHLVNSSAKYAHENCTPWPDIVDSISQGGYLRNNLPIRCQTHPEIEQEVSCFDEFLEKAPEGGCTQPCKVRLSCGHACEKACHAYDVLHEKVKCLQPCHRTCRAGHPCKQRCYEECAACVVKVTKMLPCGHEQIVPCFLDIQKATCQSPCPKLLPCEHNCANKCSEPCTVQCKIKVERELACSHTVTVACHKDIKHVLCQNKVAKKWDLCGHKVEVPCLVIPGKDPCPHPCGEPLPDCNHLCTGTCGTCRRGRMHVRCQEDCKRMLVCGHQCKSKCSKTCPPCERKCETVCHHSKCSDKQMAIGRGKKGRTCGDPCPMCMHKCKMGCPHQQCEELCNIPCKIDPCDLKCAVTCRNCGNPCIGLCGEPCPQVCRKCDPKKMKEVTGFILSALEEEPEARFIQLEDCKCILEVTGLDHWIKEAAQIHEKRTRAREIKVLCCPKCNQPIRKSLRYGRYLKMVATDIAKIKLKIKGNDPSELHSKRKEIKKDLQSLRKQMDVSGPTGMHKIWHKYRTIWEKLFEAAEKPDTKDLTRNKLEQWQNFFNLIMFDIEQLHGLSARINDDMVKASKTTHFLYDSYQKYFNGSFVKVLTAEHKFLLNWVEKNLNDASQLMIEQFAYELQRLNLLAKIVTVIYEAFNGEMEESGHEEIVDTLDLLFDTDTIDNEVADIIERLVNNWAVELNIDLEENGLSRWERLNIVQATGLTAGQWYSCPEGHLYGIGECGRAVEEGECPECKKKIGGTHRNLDDENREADSVILN